jgi:hypothetical protein
MPCWNMAEAFAAAENLLRDFTDVEAVRIVELDSAAVAEFVSKMTANPATK